jgi:hypothetical protein
MRTRFTNIAAQSLIILIVTSSLCTAGEVSVGYDNKGNLTADIAFGDLYANENTDAQYPDSAYIMYLEGWFSDGEPGPYDDSILIGAYANGDPDQGDKTGYFGCIISRSSNLFSKALDFLVHANGASTVKVSAPDPMAAANPITECLSFKPGATSTRDASINLAWAPFWLYQLQDEAGAPYQSFTGSFVPFPLSNGKLVRRVEIEELGPSSNRDTIGNAVKITAIDDSIVGQGPVFGPRFECVKPLDSVHSDVYVALANAPSRHITFGVENSATSLHCRQLYIELSTWILGM